MPELSGSTYSETDGSNNSASPNGMPEGMAPSGVNDSWRAGMGALKRAWNRLNGKNASAGGTTAYTLTPDVALAAYVNGERYSWRVNATNTGSSTIAISGLPAKTIKKVVAGAKANLVAGDLVAKCPVTVEYGSTDDDMVLCTPHGTADSASSTSASGIIELATQAEVDTGTDAVRAVAPSTLTGWTPGVSTVTLDPANDLVLIADASASNVLKKAALTALAAAQSDMETGTSTTLYVTPGRQRHHPGHPKAWAAWPFTSTPDAAFNATITDTGTGDWTINWTTAFSSANYVAFGSFLSGGSVRYDVLFTNRAAGSIRMISVDSANNQTETTITGAMVLALGDQ